MVRTFPITTVAWLLALLALSCEPLLGIEPRSLDDVEVLSAEGYEGCQRGADCDSCISPQHREQCQSTDSSVCDNPTDLDECSQCACNNCKQEVDSCQQDEGCREISECINSSRCDVLQSSKNGCNQRDICRDEIIKHGGSDAQPYLRAIAVRSCGTTQSCFVCLPADIEPPEACVAGSCQDCNGCLKTCLCSGDTYSDCSALCEEPETGCTPDNQCADCDTCFTQCSCTGENFASCASICRATCTPTTECSDCDDCKSECDCEQAATPELNIDCSTRCERPLDEKDQCLKGIEGSVGQCELCGDCLARCTCQGTELAECMTECGYESCDATSNCRACGDETCVCSTEEALVCVEKLSECDSDNSSQCSVCACTSCPAEFALCQETDNCLNTVQCMTDNQCNVLADCDECNFVGVDGALGDIGTIGGGSTEELLPRMGEILEAWKACTDAAGCESCW